MMVDDQFLKDYKSHVARYVWRYPEYRTKVLKPHTRSKGLESWVNIIPPREDTWFTRAAQSGLTNLINISYKGVDKALISAFVERWYQETNSFHLPCGELTITLHDV